MTRRAVASPVPFTLAHPAVVLPLHAKWRSGFLALVVGSFGPDIQYFLPARIGDSLPNSHTPLLALLIGTPMAFAVWIFLVVCRRIVVAPLWGKLRIAVENALRYAHSRAAWLQAIPAIMIGCEIHLVWDSFTHKNGWMALHVPVLLLDVSPLAGYPLQLCKALQYLSSIAGMIVLYIWSNRRLRYAAQQVGANSGERDISVPTVPPAWRPWSLVALAAASALAAWHAARSAPRLVPPSHGWEYIVSTSAVGTFVVLYTALGASTVAFMHARARTPRPYRHRWDGRT